MNSIKPRIVLTVTVIAVLLSFLGFLIIPQPKVSSNGSVRVFDDALGYTTQYGNTGWHLIDTGRRSNGGGFGTQAPHRATISLGGTTNVYFEVTGYMFESVNNSHGSIGIFVDGNLIHSHDFGGVSWQPLTVPFVKTTANATLSPGNHTIELKLRSATDRGQAIISKPSLWIKF